FARGSHHFHNPRRGACPGTIDGATGWWPPRVPKEDQCGTAGVPAPATPDSTLAAHTRSPRPKWPASRRRGVASSGWAPPAWGDAYDTRRTAARYLEKRVAGSAKQSRNPDTAEGSTFLARQTCSRTDRRRALPLAAHRGDTSVPVAPALRRCG